MKVDWHAIKINQSIIQSITHKRNLDVGNKTQKLLITYEFDPHKVPHIVMRYPVRIELISN